MVDDDHLAVTTYGVRNLSRFVLSLASIEATFHVDCFHSYIMRVLSETLNERSAEILTQPPDIHLAPEGLLQIDVKPGQIVELWFPELHNEVDVAVCMLRSRSV